MRVAALDLGTNTFLCLIAEATGTQDLRILHDEARVVRLGQGVQQTRRFHPEALARAQACLQDFKETIAQYRPQKIQAFATSAARDVQNAQEIFALGETLNIPIQVISGQQEAACTFWGAIGGAEFEPSWVIDVGGGSTEFIFGTTDGIQKKISVDLGSVRLTEKFVSNHPISSNEWQQAQTYVHQELEPVRELAKAVTGPRAIAVAGTPTTLAAMDLKMPFDANRVEGHIMTQVQLSNWSVELAKMSVEQRQLLAGMDRGRADVLPIGSLILSESLRAIGPKELKVSTRGLRYGIARMLIQGTI